MPSPKNTHGPVVKSGPTAGNVRTRNSNGQWRKKRSDAEATDAMEYLKKKEHEEYYGKESSISKITKGLGSLFKK